MLRADEARQQRFALIWPLRLNEAVSVLKVHVWVHEHEPEMQEPEPQTPQAVSNFI